MNLEIFNSVALAIMFTVHLPALTYTIAEYFAAKKELRNAEHKRDKAMRDAFEAHLALEHKN